MVRKEQIWEEKVQFFELFQGVYSGWSWKKKGLKKKYR